MSLHAILHGCGHVDRDVGRDVFWQAACECGWEGEPIFLSVDSEAASKTRRHYRHHIEEVLGAEGYYTAPMACRNCGVEQEQGILVGTHVTSNPCARCGTTMIEPNNEAWHEGRERSRDWF